MGSALRIQDFAGAEGVHVSGDHAAKHDGLEKERDDRPDEDSARRVHVAWSPILVTAHRLKRCMAKAVASRIIPPRMRNKPVSSSDPKART